MDDRHRWSARYFFFQLQRTSLAFNVGCSTVELLVPNSANNRRLCLHKLYNHALFNTIKRVLPLMWEYSCSSSKTLVAVKSSLHSVLLRWGGTVLLCCIIYCFVFPSQTVSEEVLGLPDVIILCTTMESKNRGIHTCRKAMRISKRLDHQRKNISPMLESKFYIYQWLMWLISLIRTQQCLSPFSSKNRIS